MPRQQEKHKIFTENKMKRLISLSKRVHRDLSKNFNSKIESDVKKFLSTHKANIDDISVSDLSKYFQQFWTLKSLGEIVAEKKKVNKKLEEVLEELDKPEEPQEEKNKKGK